jgi:outer membrane biogenesis lipoprotein LolB
MKRHLTVLFVSVAVLFLAACGTSPRRRFLAAHTAYQGAVETATVLVDHDVVDAEDVLPHARVAREGLRAWGAALAAWESLPKPVRPRRPATQAARRRVQEHINAMRAAIDY